MRQYINRDMVLISGGSTVKKENNGKESEYIKNYKMKTYAIWLHSNKRYKWEYIVVKACDRQSAISLLWENNIQKDYFCPFRGHLESINELTENQAENVFKKHYFISNGLQIFRETPKEQSEFKIDTFQILLVFIVCFSSFIRTFATISDVNNVIKIFHCIAIATLMIYTLNKTKI